MCPLNAVRGGGMIICFAAMGFANAQAYPTKPIRYIVPASAGTNPDMSARLEAAELARQMGQQVVVDNRPGGASIIGFEVIARAAPDGYTIGRTTFNLFTNAAVYPSLPYDAQRDFTGITQTTTGSDVLVIAPSLPIRSVKDLISHAKANPDKLSYGSGAGVSNQALETELFKLMTGTRIARVSYKAIQQAITDVIGGQIHVLIDNVPTLIPHIKAGRVRPLGVTTLTRSPALPDIPTLDESGLRGYERASVSGAIAPAKTPRDIVKRLNTEIVKALAVPVVREKIQSDGSSIVGSSPEQFDEVIRRETEKWGKVIKAIGMKATD